jgi:hypothetical protein
MSEVLLMNTRILRRVLVLLGLVGLGPATAAAELAAQERPSGLPTITDRTRGLDRHEGFLTYHLQPATGEMLLEVRDLDEPFLYITHTAAGASPVRRGDPDWYDGPRLVHFERRGARLLLVQRNPRYRASGIDNPGLDRTVAESLPVSVLWAFPIVAEEDDRLLAEATEFLLRDASDLAGNLRWAEEGDFRVDRDRSALVPERSGAYPDNTEVEALLTLTVAEMRGQLDRQSPDHRSLTVRQRHVFLRAPASGYRPRAFDPRLGTHVMELWDFDRPAETGYRAHQVSTRWRLAKRDPNAAVSEPVEPLVVYLEQGIPQRYRDAVREGVLYWGRAIEAAGLRDAVRVRDLPPDASPLDYRYPIVVLWNPMDHGVASIGMAVSDPTTGEALKAIVSLSSTTPLQAYREYTPVRAALGADAPPFEEVLQQKLRWLAAHEVGHVLGVNHNNASPTMVSPAAPWLRVTEDGRLAAEPERIFRGEPLPYDRWVMRYQFTPFGSAEEERAGLAAIVEEGLANGLRSPGSGGGLSPRAGQGVHGEHGLDVLERESAVRRVLLDHFDEDVLDPDDPAELLYVRLVQVYFHHRFGLRAATAAVCGVEFDRALNGDGQAPSAPVDPGVQSRALDALIAAVSPEGLALPEAASRIPPRHWAYRPFELEAVWGEPRFVPLPAFVQIETTPDEPFDPLAWARALARFVVDPVLSERRLDRCVSQHARDPRLPAAADVAKHLVEATWGAPMPRDPMQAALRRVARRVVLDRLLALAAPETGSAEVRAAALGALARLEQDLRGRRPAADAVEVDHLRLALREIGDALDEGGR